MAVASRSTLVVYGRLAMREGRLAAAHDGRHGLQVMSFEQAAVRLAGGFIWIEVVGQGADALTGFL